MLGYRSRLEAFKIVDATADLGNSVGLESLTLDHHYEAELASLLYHSRNGCFSETERDTLSAHKAVLEVYALDPTLKTLEGGDGIDTGVERPEGIDLKMHVRSSFKLAMDG